MFVCLFEMNRLQNYWANQDENFTTYALRPGMVLGKNLKKFKRGPKWALFAKNAFFSNISIIYDPIELKL